MCILSYLPADAELDTDGLWTGGINNPDGHGWAIAHDGRIYVGKSLNLAEALDGFEAARKAHPGGDALFHSRWATHGAINPVNCHPFYVGQSKKTVVGHNGILPAAAHPGKGDPRSDTRKFADEILSTRYRRLDKKRAFQALSGWIGNHNKLVILTVDPRYRRNAYLVNEHAGQWDTGTGIWHSNSDYLGVPAWLGKYTSAIALKALDHDDHYATLAQDEADLYHNGRCFICNDGAVNAWEICADCGTCQDCFELDRDCQCYWRGAKQADYDRPAGAYRYLPDTMR